MSNRIVCVAGDPSGDIHTAAILRKIKQRNSQATFSGIGGPAMQAEGLVPLYPFERFAKMGIAEVIPSLPFFLRTKSNFCRYLHKERPAALLLVDYAGFNIQLLETAHALNIPVIWFIPPKVWGWKKKRAEKLKAYCHTVATIFPFEQNYFSGGKARVEFVGNPLIKSTMPLSKKAEDCVRTLGFFPGSRVQEVTRMVPLMCETFKRLRQMHGIQLNGVISRVAWLKDAAVFDLAKNAGLQIDNRPLLEIAKDIDFAVVTSGTATLESALANLPHILVYKTSLATYALAKLLWKHPWIGLPNLVARKCIVPECIQNEATPQSVSRSVDSFIRDKQKRLQMFADFAELRSQLGTIHYDEKLSDIICSILQQK